MSFDTSKTSQAISTWSEFKKYINGTYFSGSFSFFDKGDHYFILTEELAGSKKSYVLPKSDGSDRSDFETNFSSSISRTPLGFKTFVGDNPVTGSNPLPITGSVTIFAASGSFGGRIEGLYPHSGTNASNPVMIAGSDGSKVLTFLVDDLGRIITAPAGSSTSVTSSLESGYVSTAATTKVPVRATTYTEQTTNAQRSIVSANANDTSAGTGARTVTLMYFDQNMNGPYTETLTLAGTTPVNTVATNICFIEDLRVTTVGSGGSNAGIISLKESTGGGGATICSIVAGDNRLFYAMHYVPAGQDTYITGISVSHNGTTVGSGGVFTINAQAVLTANSANVQVSDFIRQYGQASNTGRTWGTAIKVSGPSRIQVYVTPESSTSLVYRAALDLYDQ